MKSGAVLEYEKVFKVTHCIALLLYPTFLRFVFLLLYYRAVQWHWCMNISCKIYSTKLKKQRKSKFFSSGYFLLYSRAHICTTAATKLLFLFPLLGGNCCVKSIYLSFACNCNCNCLQNVNQTIKRNKTYL
jgi:hypothetical protein